MLAEMQSIMFGARLHDVRLVLNKFAVRQLFVAPILVRSQACNSRIEDLPLNWETRSICPSLYTTPKLSLRSRRE